MRVDDAIGRRNGMKYMIIKKCPVAPEGVLDKIKACYDYGLIYMISEMFFKKTEEINEIKWDECVEARFFSEKSEMHIFNEDGVLVATQIIDDIEGTFDDSAKEKTVLSVGEGDIREAEIIDLEYETENRFKDYGRTFKVRKYMAPDEDGQMIVLNTRLVSKGGE